MLLNTAIQKFAGEVAGLVHADRKKEAAQHVAEFCKIRLVLDSEDPSKYLPVLQNWLHWLLNNGGVSESAQLLWTPNLFNPAPQFTQDVWEFFQQVSRGLIMGGSSCSKSFSLGVRLFLEWIRDPDWTSVKVAGPSQDHLEANLFSALVRLHKQASLPMPGHPGELFIGEDRRNQLGSIKGIVIPLGRLKKSGRLQGSKREKRPHPHPLFGERSRMFIFMDECENIPEGIWDDVSNVLSQTSKEVAGFKILGAYNPVNPAHEVGKHAEPVNGWSEFNPDKDFRWVSKRGWSVLRLDGERCENVIQGREIFSGLQTREGLDAIAKSNGGKESAGYATQGRGMYPQQGALCVIIPPGMFMRSRGTFIWLNDPVPVGSCDLALQGGAAALFTLGEWGLATGMKLPPNLEHPKGRTVMFKNAQGQVVPRYGLQANQQFPLLKGDSVEMALRTADMCKKTGVKPIYFCCDRTGTCNGVADNMRHQWGPELHDVNYSEGPSEGKLMLEDKKTCEEEYDRVHSELWYALRGFMEHGYLLIDPAMDASILQQQCTDRLVKHGSHKSRVESKEDYMGRHNNRSPDEADSLTLLVHAARKGSGIVLSRLGESVSEGDEDWYDSGVPYRGGARIDPSNRTESLYIS